MLEPANPRHSTPMTSASLRLQPAGARTPYSVVNPMSTVIAIDTKARRRYDQQRRRTSVLMQPNDRVERPHATPLAALSQPAAAGRKGAAHYASRSAPTRC